MKRSWNNVNNYNSGEKAYQLAIARWRTRVRIVHGSGMGILPKALVSAEASARE
jgi:hypothetical protein